MGTGIAIKPRQWCREKHIQCVAAELLRRLEQRVRGRRRVVRQWRHGVSASVAVGVLNAHRVGQVRRMGRTVSQCVVLRRVRMCTGVTMISTTNGALLGLQGSGTSGQRDTSGATAGSGRSHEHRQVRGTVAWETNTIRKEDEGRE